MMKPSPVPVRVTPPSSPLPPPPPPPPSLPGANWSDVSGSISSAGFLDCASCFRTSNLPPSPLFPPPSPIREEQRGNGEKYTSHSNGTLKEINPINGGFHAEKSDGKVENNCKMKFSNSIENLDSSDDPDEVEEASIEYEICEESEEDLEGSHFVLEITSKKEEVVEEPPLCGLWNLKKQV